ncbi:MAG TPA: PspC domain-containing protein, partial [Solirubrobacteraceae bacterium]
MSTAAPPPESPPTPPASPFAPRRLTRSTTDRVAGGVAGGLGRYFDVDPVVFRIGFAATAFAGGVGLFVYIAALLFVPADDGSSTPFDRHRVLTVAGAVLLGIAVLSAVDGDLFWGPIVPLAVLAAIGYAIVRAVRHEGPSGPLTAGRVVTWLAIGLGAVLGLMALAGGAAWAAAEGSGAAVAALVIAIGAALLVSAARPGGARWLAVPALAIAIPLGLVAAADV